jgi:hypothetical protein
MHVLLQRQDWCAAQQQLGGAFRQQPAARLQQGEPSRARSSYASRQTRHATSWVSSSSSWLGMTYTAVITATLICKTQGLPGLCHKQTATLWPFLGQQDRTCRHHQVVAPATISHPTRPQTSIPLPTALPSSYILVHPDYYCSTNLCTSSAVCVQVQCKLHTAPLGRLPARQAHCRTRGRLSSHPSVRTPLSLQGQVKRAWAVGF